MIRKSLNTVQVLNLGKLSSYNAGLQVQKYFQNLHLNNTLNESAAQQILLIVEHNPVYTLGFRESLDPKEYARLNSLGAEVIKSDRGGLTTFHGPGQLVVYPIINLNKWYRTLTLRTYVGMLEAVAIHTCRMIGIPASTSALSVAHTGAWVNDKKICAIGVHCKRHITTHGLALNCNIDLKWFENIVPCGIQDKGVTSISEQLQKTCTIQTILPQFLASFQAIFRCQLKNSITQLEDILSSLSEESDKISTKQSTN